jgi:hypothetical protein
MKSFDLQTPDFAELPTLVLVRLVTLLLPLTMLPTPREIVTAF